MDNGKDRLAGKVAIVTGAGSRGPGVGTGKAASTLFAREGASILLVDATPERAEETRASIESEGGTASVLQADVTREDDCARIAEQAVERYGRLDILFNNVGIGSPGTVLDVLEEDFDRVMATNIRSMVFTSKYAVPRMAQTGGGSIINISSIAGIRAGSSGASIPYAISKGGVIALTTQMSVHHGRDGVRVNCIAPGPLYTPMVAGRLSEEGTQSATPQHSARHRGQRVGHRMGSPLPRKRRGALDYGRNPARGRRRPRHNPALHAGAS